MHSSDSQNSFDIATPVAARAGMVLVRVDLTLASACMQDLTMSRARFLAP